MLTLKAIQDSFLKRTTDQASTLPGNQKIAIAAKTEHPINWYSVRGDHVLCEIVSQPNGFFNWYGFAKHFQIIQDGKVKEDFSQPAPNKPALQDEILLSVPFWNQVDNIEEPHRTCNTSSNAMAAKFLGAAIGSDDQYKNIVDRYGDTTDHGAQTKALAELGIKSQWRTDLDFKDLDDSLKAGLPVVIGILHRGPESAPAGGGHILVVVGKTKNGDYIVNDPYGSVNDNYQGPVSNGDRAVYKRSTLKSRWQLHQQKNGWGRTFYA